MRNAFVTIMLVLSASTAFAHGSRSRSIGSYSVQQPGGGPANQYSYLFDRAVTNSGFEIADSTIWKPTSSISVAFWIYRTASTLANSSLVSARSGVEGSFDILLHPAGPQHLFFAVGCGFNDMDSETFLNAVNLDTWTFIVVTFDAAANANQGDMRAYKNGVELPVNGADTDFTPCGGAIYQAATALRLGFGGQGLGFTGGLDRVLIFKNYVLSGAEIASLYTKSTNCADVANAAVCFEGGETENGAGGTLTTDSIAGLVGSRSAAFANSTNIPVQ